MGQLRRRIHRLFRFSASLKVFDFSVSLIALVGIAIVSVLIMLNMPLALKSLWRKKEDEDEEVVIHKMSSVDDEKNPEEAKEKNGDKNKKNNRRQKDKKKTPTKKLFEIKTDLKKSRSDFVPPR